MNNEQLSLELMSGNRELRNGLIMQWLPWIKKVVRENSEGTEDRLHDAIAYLATYLHKYDGSSGIYTWIRLGCLGGLRSTDYRKKHPTVGGCLYLDAVSTITPATELNRKLKAEFARLALNTLKQDCALLLIRRFWTGLKLKELALIYDVSEQAIDQRIKKYLRILKRNISA